MSFNSMKNGPTKEELQKELTLAQSVGNREKASSIVKQLKEMDDPTEANKRKKIESDLSDAQAKGERDKAQKLIDQLKEIDSPTKNNKFAEDFNENFKKLSGKKVITQKELKEFLEKDVKNYKENLDTNTKLIEESKQAEIDRLRKQLSGAMSEEFSLKEYFSLERVRLAKLRKTFESLKNNAKEYPKNVLIYAMSFTKGLIGMRQGVKRGRYKMALKRNSNKIGSKIGKLETDLQPKVGESERRRFTKQLVLEQVKEAKVHYLNQVQKDIGLAA